jgi:hypothetical protein
MDASRASIDPPIDDRKPFGDGTFSFDPPIGDGTFSFDPPIGCALNSPSRGVILLMGLEGLQPVHPEFFFLDHLGSWLITIIDMSSHR